MKKQEQHEGRPDTGACSRRKRGRAAWLSALVLAVLLPLVTLPLPARAEFTLIDRADAWFFYMQRGVGRRYAACQVVSCLRGTCEMDETARTQFSLYDARDGHGAMPEFISPRRVPPGARASLFVDGTRFDLVNRFGSPQYFLQANTDSAQQIVDALRQLEARDALGRFVVRDAGGEDHVFTVRGVTRSLDRMERRCTRRY